MDRGSATLQCKTEASNKRGNGKMKGCTNQGGRWEVSAEVNGERKEK